jgi:hypothetical protein
MAAELLELGEWNHVVLINLLLALQLLNPQWRSLAAVRGLSRRTNKTKHKKSMRTRLRKEARLNSSRQKTANKPESEQASRKGSLCACESRPRSNIFLHISGTCTWEQWPHTQCSRPARASAAKAKSELSTCLHREPETQMSESTRLGSLTPVVKEYSQTMEKGTARFVCGSPLSARAAFLCFSCSGWDDALFHCGLDSAGADRSRKMGAQSHPRCCRLIHTKVSQRSPPTARCAVILL